MVFACLTPNLLCTCRFNQRDEHGFIDGVLVGSTNEMPVGLSAVRGLTYGNGGLVRREVEG